MTHLQNRSPNKSTITEEIARVLSGPAHPGRDFVKDRTSYETLYRLADAIGRDLRRDLPRGRPAVCLCTEDKTIIAAALLASLSEGFDLVLPPAASGRAVAEIRGNMNVSVVITDRPRNLPDGSVSYIPQAVPNPSRAVGSDRLPIIGPDTPFLTFFTGGSTGQPRMWSKTPRNLFAEAFFHADRFGIGPADRILATVSPLHIYGFLYTILIPLVASAAVVEGICTFPEEIRAALTRHEPTLFASVPVHYRVLNTARIPGASLRMALSSAGMLAPSDGDTFHRNTGVGVTEIYGSTETGGIADRCRAHGETSLRPFDILDWKIKDERLCVRSPFLSPEIETDADGFFTTGDRAAADGRNLFTLLGRADGVVKVGGNRVDLEAVRDALMQIPGVEEAVVLAAAAGAGRENELYAVIQGDMAPDALKTAAIERIAPHAVPRRFKIVERMPVSASGKYPRDEMIGLFGKEG